jgi:hypothetical protein
MAEDDDKKKDEIIDTKLIKEARKEYEELEVAIDNMYKTAQDREKARLLQLEAQRQAADDSLIKLKQDIEDLEFISAEQSGARRRLTEEQIDGLKKLYEIRERLDRTGNESELESYKNLMDKKIKENDRFLSALGRVKGGISDAFSDIDAAALQAMGAVLGLSAVFGVELPNYKDLFSEFAVSLDDARRSIVPFSKNISEANQLQQAFGKVSDDIKIPITDLGESVGGVGSQFRMFALQGLNARASLVAFHAQMKNMGVESGTSIIESIMSEGGVASAEDATDIFKALTVRMKDLGVMPQTLADDYNKLIGTFSMFGDAAQMNIARTSLAAAKAKVDVGAITGFGDNFSGYSQAASTAQQINAIFGRRVIDNPAELVSIFYTGGGEAALEYVKRKLVTSGVDLEEMLGGAAGAARLRMLGGMGFGSAQAASRALLSDTAITPAEAEGIQAGDAPRDLTRRFDALAEEMLTQADRVKQMNEEVTVRFFENMGVGLGKFGDMFDDMLEKVRVGLMGENPDAQIGGLLKVFIGEADREIPGFGGVDPATGKLQKESVKGLIKSLMGGENEALRTATEKATTSQKFNTEQLDRLNTNLENMALASASPGSAGGGTSAAASTSPEGMAIKLVVNGTEMNAYLKGAIDKISKGVV